jgi:hypothetical protein
MMLVSVSVLLAVSVSVVLAFESRSRLRRTSRAAPNGGRLFGAATGGWR